MDERESKYVLGDVDVPPGTELLQGIVATGVLKVGDGCVCRGHLVGAEGVHLGSGVEVHGDVLSSGPIHLGPGHTVHGRIGTLARGPAGDDAPAPDDAAPPPPTTPPRPADDAGGGPVVLQPEADLLVDTMDATTRVLLTMSRDAHRRGVAEDDGAWWGMRWDAALETAEGLLEVADQVYRGGSGQRVWTSDDVFAVLLRRVIASVVPLSLTRKGPDLGLLTVAPPTVEGDDSPPKGWARPVLSVIRLVCTTAHPGFRLEAIDGDAAFGPEASPERVHAIVALHGSMDDA